MKLIADLAETFPVDRGHGGRTPLVALLDVKAEFGGVVGAPDMRCIFWCRGSTFNWARSDREA